MKLADFIKMFKEGKKYTRSHMKNLIEMALIDGSYDEAEKELINELAKKHGVSLKSLSSISEEADAIELEVPEDEEEKFHQLYDLAQMMSIDDDIHRDEEKLCRVMAYKFGYPKEKIDELIASIVSNIKQGNDYKDTMSRMEWLLH